MRALLMALALGGASALQVGPAAPRTSRRAVVASIPALVGAAGSALAESGKDQGLFTKYSYTEKDPRRAAGVRLAGEFSDPNHPGCKRKISLVGTNKATIFGADEDGVPWKLKAEVSGKSILIDFSPKVHPHPLALQASANPSDSCALCSQGGPKDVEGRWNGIGIVFPDGNVWTRL